MTFDDNSNPTLEAVLEEVEQSDQKRCNLVCRDISTATRLVIRYRKKYYERPDLMNTYYIDRRGNLITIGKY